VVAVVTGVGLGLERSSASLLGPNGVLGTPAQGQGGDDVSVNAATGNLIDQRVDEILTGTGLDDVISDTYNSLGTFTANDWQADYQRAVTGLTGTVNTVGSTVTHVAADGSKVVYSWSAAQSAYVGNEDAGAYDTITFNSGTNQWTWTDGETQLTEVYDAANGGRIVSSTDTNGNALTYSYTSGLLTSITTTDTGGQGTELTDAWNLTQNFLNSVNPDSPPGGPGLTDFAIHQFAVGANIGDAGVNAWAFIDGAGELAELGRGMGLLSDGLRASSSLDVLTGRAAGIDLSATAAEAAAPDYASSVGAAEGAPYIKLPSQLPAGFDTSAPIGRFAVPADAVPGTTTFGDYAHQQIGDLIQGAAPNADLTLNTAPGMKGVDLIVGPGDVSRIGFQFGEIKPLSPYGIRSYNSQVLKWNLPGPVQAITYDSSGNIYLGFPKVK